VEMALPTKQRTRSKTPLAPRRADRAEPMTGMVPRALATGESSATSCDNVHQELPGLDHASVDILDPGAPLGAARRLRGDGRGGQGGRRRSRSRPPGRPVAGSPGDDGNGETGTGTGETGEGGGAVVAGGAAAADCPQCC
jgi:hypothetical protein